MPLISGERKYAFSANASGSDSTWMGDRLGIQGAVDITYFSFLISFFFILLLCMHVHVHNCLGCPKRDAFSKTIVEKSR